MRPLGVQLQQPRSRLADQVMQPPRTLASAVMEGADEMTAPPIRRPTDLGQYVRDELGAPESEQRSQMMAAAMLAPFGITAFHGSPHRFPPKWPETDYPLANYDDWWGNRTFQQDGGRMTTMTPDEYLSQTRSMGDADGLTRETVTELVDHIKGGGKLDPVALYGKGLEDGRHRALAAKELGISKIPVLNYREGATGNYGPLGAFDATKIGTGEGAQAYGHGLYFAENPKVAGEYAGRLANLKIPLDAGDIKHASSMLQAWKDPARAKQALMGGTYKMTSGQADAAISAAKGTQNLYKVDIPDEAVGKMLDWDAPLSKQPESVQTAVKKLWQDQRIYGDPSKLTGEGIHGSITAHYLQVGMPKGAGKDAGAKDLRYYGIPGIKYLDQGSRAGGEGTRNFVLFDENLPKILERK